MTTDSNSPEARAKAFLEIASQFRLGSLVTESPHPKTQNLSELCRDDLTQATLVFRELELDALNLLLQKADLARHLADSIRRVHMQGHKVFMCGCGATGRLSMVLESVWRSNVAPEKRDAVMAFTAGGDYALVRSLGVFEDRQELGGRHLLDLGFTDGDLLIAITEGGETPFVLGALETAANVSREMPWLFFCNPPDLLSRIADRSRRAIENPRVHAHALEIAPMAVTGSTRLQASSVLMALVGAALEEAAGGMRAPWIFNELCTRVQTLDPTTLAPLIEMEAELHTQNLYSLHRSQTAAIAVLTDTTERSPTFSLAPFENDSDTFAGGSLPSRTYLEIPEAKDSRQAWQVLIGRTARPFSAPTDLPFYNQLPKIDATAIAGFNFSSGVAARREKHGIKTEAFFDVEIDARQHTLTFGAQSTRTLAGRTRAHATWTGSDNALINQALVKLALNLQSTLTMGRIGRFHGNLMTFVRPTNNKLIGRAIGSLRVLAEQDLARHGTKSDLGWIHGNWDDEPLLIALFAAADRVSSNEPTVLQALELLRRSV